MNTSDFLLENARDVTCTHDDLKSSAARLAGDLLALGLRPGERVGILGQNSLFWAAAYLAAMKLGLVAVP